MDVPKLANKLISKSYRIAPKPKLTPQMEKFLKDLQEKIVSHIELARQEVDSIGVPPKYSKNMIQIKSMLQNTVENCYDILYPGYDEDPNA